MSPFRPYEQAAPYSSTACRINHDRLNQTDSSLVSNAHNGQDIFNEVQGSGGLQLLPAMHSLWSEAELFASGPALWRLGKEFVLGLLWSRLTLDLAFLSPGLTGNP